MSSTMSSPFPADVAAPARLFEMRVYEARLGSGARLVGMFEQSFRPLYESVGVRIVASFNDLDSPDRWVWFRAFPDAAARGAALTAFYTHPRWLELRRAANALIARSSDARLLVPEAWHSLPLENGTLVECARIVGPSVHRYRSDVALAMSENRGHGVETVGVLASCSARNTYPRQRLHQEPACVWLTRFGHPDEYARHVAARSQSPAWRAIENGGVPLQRWRLAATR